MDSDYCSSTNATSRKTRFQRNKLTLLKLFRDSLERRIAATNAAITKLEEQIERDNKVVEN